MAKNIRSETTRRPDRNMSNYKTLISCIFGPRLYHFYKFVGDTLNATTPEVLRRSHPYQSSSLESNSDNVVKVAKALSSFGTYISPFLFTYLVYKRNVPGSYVESLDHEFIIKLFTTACCSFMLAFCLRGYARYINPEYLSFLKVLEEVRTNPTVSNKRILSRFDADFSAYPVDFKWSEAQDNRYPSPYYKSFPSPEKPTLILDGNVIKYPLEVIASLIMKSIGRRLIYPGSLGILQAIMGPAIAQGRAKLIEENKGARNKLETPDANHIDTMFVDERGTNPNGEYLVIGCEGNGGFYELGAIFPALAGGYSVLGWNHPGFGGSTGTPVPDEEVAAIDTVVKFAVHKLGFDLNKIIIYGWSIGGFTATWAAMRYPDIDGLIVDASFDHITLLAKNMFPGFIYPIIELAIKQHFDLDNTRHLKYYKGPVLLIRRSQDEVLATDPYDSPNTNRANQLLIDLLEQRFPRLMDFRSTAVLKEYLAGDTRHQNDILRKYSVKGQACMKLLTDYFHTHRTAYPVDIGEGLNNTSRDQLVLFLASKFMIDYDSVHCAPLPPHYIQKPWNLIGLAMSGSNL